MADTAPTTRRRWFQFSVSRLLGLTLLVALALYGFGERQRRVRSEAEAESLRVEVSALNTKYDDAQNRALSESHKWVVEIRRINAENHSREMGASKGGALP